MPTCNNCDILLKKRDFSGVDYFKIIPEKSFLVQQFFIYIKIDIFKDVEYNLYTAWMIFKVIFYRIDSNSAAVWFGKWNSPVEIQQKAILLQSFSKANAKQER